MSIALNTAPARSLPISGKLTIAHLKPRLTPAPSQGQEAMSSDAQVVGRVPSAPPHPPLKAEKPKPVTVSVRAAPPQQDADTNARSTEERQRKRRRRGTYPPVSCNPFLRQDHSIHRFHAFAHARWPEAFPAIPPNPDDIAVRPLALGVGRAIAEALPDDITEAEFKKAMKAWTRMRPYLAALIAHEGQPRIRLDGQRSEEPCDIVTTAQAEFARVADKWKIAKELRLGRTAAKEASRQEKP